MTTTPQLDTWQARLTWAIQRGIDHLAPEEKTARAAQNEPARLYPSDDSPLWEIGWGHLSDGSPWLLSLVDANWLADGGDIETEWIDTQVPDTIDQLEI